MRAASRLAGLIFCASVLVIASASSSRAATSPPGVRVDVVRSVSAVYEAGLDGTYAVGISAGWDLTTHQQFATANGELADAQGEFYYIAQTSGRDIGFRAAWDLKWARLTSRLRIVSCTDAQGAQINGARCPVGREMPITATWTSDQALKHFFDSSQAGYNFMRGRLGKSTAKFDEVPYELSEYAVLAENVLLLRDG